MLKQIAGVVNTRITVGLAALIALASTDARAQDRLKTMPGYDQFTRMANQIQGSVKLGQVTPTWADDGKTVAYNWDDKWYQFDFATRAVTELADAPAGAAAGGGRGGRGGRGGGGGGGNRGGQGGRGQAPPAGRGGRGVAAVGAAPERGRQVAAMLSPDNLHLAFYRDRNFWVSDSSGANEIAVTTEGSVKTRIKYGTASWVYGEELGQTVAFLWAPGGKKVAYYRFDESGVPDYFLQMHQLTLYDSVDAEAYPKPGVPNPVVDLFVYDLATKKSTKLNVRDGKPFTNDVVGHYVYQMAWSPDGSEITFNRTNRRQNILEHVACGPETGACRVIVREDWPTGWVENHPPLRFLADNKRFIWESERNGFKNYYMYDWSGKQLGAITSNQFEAQAILRVDEKAGVLWYTARDGDNFMKSQLHRVGLDGKGDRRLTDPAFNHTVNLSPDGKYFTDVSQTHDQPPVTRLVDADGKVVAELAHSDLSKFTGLGLRTVEMFTYLAADGQTRLYGSIAFPSNFDASKQYPTLVSVYGGPAAANNVPTENFTLPSGNTEYGFLVVSLDSRAVPGMGKRTLDAIYLKLGQVEMDDMAEGVKALWSRPYFDKNRVGIYGTSYGGYTSAMEIVRHPEVFAVASASSPPTDWRNYDTIYTERYMWIPDENRDGYDKGSVMTYAANLRGRLLIYYGTSDNNVHPTNSMQLIKALQQAGKSFEVQVGPDMGHSGVNGQHMMEFFIENLVIRPGTN